LADTARAEVVATEMQFRDKMDPSTLIGRGKAEEIARKAEALGAEVIIFDQELSPAQLVQLERIMNRKVIDRTQLILDIFALRAKTREGRCQVELAQLEYLLPRLVGRGRDLSRLGGESGPGSWGNQAGAGPPSYPPPYPRSEAGAGTDSKAS